MAPRHTQYGIVSTALPIVIHIKGTESLSNNYIEWLSKPTIDSCDNDNEGYLVPDAMGQKVWF